MCDQRWYSGCVGSDQMELLLHFDRMRTSRFNNIKDCIFTIYPYRPKCDWTLYNLQLLKNDRENNRFAEFSNEFYLTCCRASLRNMKGFGRTNLSNIRQHPVIVNSKQTYTFLYFVVIVFCLFVWPGYWCIYSCLFCNMNILNQLRYVQVYYSHAYIIHNSCTWDNFVRKIINKTS